MAHNLVPSFFRTSSPEQQHHQKGNNRTTATDRIRRPSSSGRRRTTTQNISTPPCPSVFGPDTGMVHYELRMDERPSPKTTNSDHGHHRLSIASLGLGKSKKEKEKDHPSNSHAGITWRVESPPIIFHGDRENSTGALVSGLLFLEIKDEGYEIDSFKTTLNIHITQKKPFTVGCKDCTHQYTEVKSWSHLPKPMAMTKGEHGFPVSVLLGGHLPATLDSPLVSISYEFTAIATPKSGTPLKLERILDVKRSLYLPEAPHHSIRVFPPTNLKADVEYPQMIHPVGDNTVTMRLDGIAKVNQSVKTVEYWRLKKLTWKLEETSKAIAPACARHAPKSTTAAGESTSPARKGLQRQETHLIGEKAIFQGWKTVLGGADDSQIEFELSYHIAKHAKFSCDIKSAEGSEVSHQLTLEMVVSQEYAPIGKPSAVTSSGVGRILRMSFPTVLTERPGIGISWDNEQPPIYQDVPPSPPTYNTELAKGTVQEIAIPTYLETLDGGSGAGPSGSGGSPRSSAENVVRRVS